MALTINTNIKNDSDGYSLDSKQVKGGYVSVSTITERDALPPAIISNGSLCHVVENDVFYIYKNNSWAEVKFGKTYTADGETLQLTDTQFSLKSVPFQYIESATDDTEILLVGGSSDN